MKKVKFFIALIMGLFITITVKAQAPKDYFVGKWTVTVFGTPDGDKKMNFVFERKDGKLTGTVRDSTDKEVTKIAKVDEDAKNITANFNISNFDVSMVLEPLDDDHVKGSVMGMFDAKGVRLKENDPTKSN
jgi:hypothetical protein